MKIRQTTQQDLPTLLEIFAYGRRLQRSLGNHFQWRNGHPSRQLLEEDIATGTSYVCVADQTESPAIEPGTILATFHLRRGENPVFHSLEQGTWVNEAPYVTVERMCSNGKTKGACQFCLQWVTQQFGNVRIFTHETNKPMLHIVQKYGFQYCGEIFPEDGEPRKAFQYASKQYIGVMK